MYSIHRIPGILWRVAVGAALIVASLIVATAASPAAAQDFRVLRDTRPFDPDVKPAAQPLQTVGVLPRVILAGDSWAQYMWDDESHNDIFDKFGHMDKLAVSASLDADPGPGYVGFEYAISGSEARQWVDTANYPWIANLKAALTANPTVDVVMLSVGGNDVLAGRPDGGWYKDMDLDAPGSEQILFDRIRDDTYTIVDSLLAVRPELKVLLSSYDYPNFNVGFWCFLYACGKRDDLSRDPVNDLINDAELNGMMVGVEAQRVGWTNARPEMLYDHSVGLMHHYYGDGVTGPGLLSKPGQAGPGYLPFPGGNPLRPTLRMNFRVPGLDADPIHLDYEGYQFKITTQTETFFFPHFRDVFTESFASRGGAEDGWTDGSVMGTGSVRLGADSLGAIQGILSFDTSSIPDGAVITDAHLYLHRTAAAGVSPLFSGSLGSARIDVVTGSFGNPALEVSDATAPADVVGGGEVYGSARADGYAARAALTPAGAAAINAQGLTQIRLSFPGAVSAADNWVGFAPGGGTPAPAHFLPTLAQYMGSADPFLDVTYTVVTAVGDPLTEPGTRLLPSSPNPFVHSTTIPFSLTRGGLVRLRVFDVSGRLVTTLLEGERSAGSHRALWNGRDGQGRRAAPGIYFARLESAGTHRTTRLVLAP